jgi:hypothetical protein
MIRQADLKGDRRKVAVSFQLANLKLIKRDINLYILQRRASSASRPPRSACPAHLPSGKRRTVRHPDKLRSRFAARVIGATV